MPISSDELIQGVPSATLTTTTIPQTSPQLVLQPDTSLLPFIAPKFTHDAEMEFHCCV